MSGGVFDYVDTNLDTIIIPILKEIIEEQKIETEYPRFREKKSYDYIKLLIKHIKLLRTILHDFDWSASGDNNEQEFQTSFEKYNKDMKKLVDKFLNEKQNTKNDNLLSSPICVNST
jgi:hypothetical protein